MPTNQKIKTSLGIVFVSLIIGFGLYILPAITTFYNNVKANKAAIDRKVNYKSYTTPLSKEVVEDICAKLEIQISSKDCAADAVVYAPDLFDEIEEYFRFRIARERTYEFFDQKLGAYLVRCDIPKPSKSYLCEYDLRGDGQYPIRVVFDKYNRYYPPDPRLRVDS